MYVVDRKTQKLTVTVDSLLHGDPKVQEMDSPFRQLMQEQERYMRPIKLIDASSFRIIILDLKNPIEYD